WYFEDSGTVRSPEGEVLPYDLCLTPRRSHVTGDISGHEAGWYGDELIVVNTRFSCLAKLDPSWSFVPIWRPPFVTAYAAEDRCHLNGLVLDANGPKYVTALGETDTKEGWREGKVDGGIIIDVPSGEVISRGISMPHSPRWYAGRLWVLESGTGSLQVVDIQSGKRSTVLQLPGYLRGLTFFDRYAFVGLCRIRGDRDTFGGMPIEEMVSDLKCAIYAVDITTGEIVGFIEFTKGIEELFDIQVLPGIRRPHLIGFEEDTINGLFVVDL
ncbi:MAG: TIGR03032 family protein, partial [Bdellovibrionales bacterium]|nr:TIGR03032 family protein [Bdellovibrionales bacterium]